MKLIVIQFIMLSYMCIKYALEILVSYISMLIYQLSWLEFYANNAKVIEFYANNSRPT